MVNKDYDKDKSCRLLKPKYVLGSELVMSRSSAVEDIIMRSHTSSSTSSYGLIYSPKQIQPKIASSSDRLFLATIEGISTGASVLISQGP